jgi:type VI secretion system protein ImpL
MLRVSQVPGPQLSDPVSSKLLSVHPAVVAAPPRRDIAFIRHLFQFRIFSETRAARPVTRIRIARRRNVLAAQLMLAVFLIVFTVGTVHAWSRLGALRDQRYLGLLDRLENDLSLGSAEKSTTPPSVQTAYDLVDTLGTVNASGFNSVFLPYSYVDPLDHRLADTLAAAFGRIVFPAFSGALDLKAKDLLGSCEAAKETDPVSDGFGPALSSVNFTKDPDYLALGRFDRKYVDLEAAITRYDAVRRVGLGSLKDFDALFQYLLGKGLTNSDTVMKSQYYRHAVSTASGSPLPVTNNRYLETCAQRFANSLVKNFYVSWFENNPLLANTEEVGGQIEDLESRKLQANDALAALSTRIRDLDGQISTGPMNWLTATTFDAGSYPALSRLLVLPFADEDFRQQITKDGDKGLSALKSQLFSAGSELSGSVLVQHGTEVRLSGNVIALEAGVQALLHQEFTGEADTVPSSGGTVIWNKSGLMKAAQLPSMYDKYAREQLPVLPPSLRSPIQQIAARNVNRSATAEVAAAEEPQSSLDEATALMAIRSFNDAAPILSQLQAALPDGGVSTNTGFHLILNRQSVALAKWLNAQLVQQPAYPYSVDTDANDSGRATSLQLFKAASQDEIEEYLASQRDRIRSLAVDYASPLASYLQSQGLQHAADFDRWSSIVRDVHDYDAKKPGNPIAALEGFIRGDLNKISLESGCQITSNAAHSNDYFVQLRSNIQNAAVQECSHVALNTYSNQIAGFFNAKLAGRFPFGPIPSQTGAIQADPSDVAEFLARIGKQGSAFKQFFASSPRFSEELLFINQCLALHDMLSATPPGQLPAADVTVYFRVNQAAEKGGNQIIDWSLESGDLSVHYPGTESSLRWHYGDSVRLSLRYAKDSPRIPRAGNSEPNQQIDGRLVSWDYPGPWSLFALLAEHGGQASSFGITPELLPSTLGFVIPVVSDTSLQKAPATAANEGTTAVFVRIALRVPDGKQAREVPVVAPPTKAPIITALSAKA